MVKTKKFAKYEYDTKITTIRIPDLNDLDMEKSLRKAIDGFVIERLFTKSNSKTNTIDNELIDKLILLMIKAGINSDNYGIDITMEEINSNIERLKERGLI